MLNKNKVGIIGFGFVGQILKRYYLEAKVYDIKGGTDKWEDVQKCEVIFIAINQQDNCAGEKSRSDLNNYFATMEKGTIVIIKSTFIPGTLDFFQEKYPYLRFVYNCEFLTEATAWEDFTKPQFQILGMPHNSLRYVQDVFALLPDAPVKRVVSPLDAEVLKHTFNSYYATKVTWFNQLYDFTKEIGADYETIREILIQNPWVGNSHSVVVHKGYRGFGTPTVSKCLPKDLNAMIRTAKFPLLEEVKKYNDELNKQQGFK